MLCFSKVSSLNWDSGLVLRSKIRDHVVEETGHIYVHKSQREKVFFTLLILPEKNQTSYAPLWYIKYRKDDTDEYT